MIAPIKAKRLYTTKERLQLKGLQNRFKRYRNAAVSAWFCRRKVPESDEFLRAFGDVSDKNLLFTIAFREIWTIDLLARSVARHMPEWTLVVIDNSREPAERAAIAAVARKYGLPYLGLPANPEWSPNRSHGLALNWTWRNIVRVLRPRHIGFIDHDCFPIAATPFNRHLETQPVDGPIVRPRFVENAWYIWAGSLFFDFAKVEGVKLDFNHDQHLRLDTGGRLWSVLFRHLDECDLDLVQFVPLSLTSPDGERVYTPTCIDSCLVHFGGGSYRRGEEADRYRATVVGLVEEAMAD
jgi:hypothetical protein